MEPEEGGVIAGKYQLVAPLARGGMGMVWTARHVKLGSRLAVKFVDPSYAKDPAFLTRFEREARAAAVIESPHVVHVQDFGIEDGTPYLVMELLHGEDLGMRLRRQRRLSLAETARILAQAGHALRRAHEAGIIHRDLKPANLYLARVYDQEAVKVLDFGIAKETGAHVGEMTTTGEVIGSPHYMGPEQARADKDIDHRSDLWSVGVLVYRMVTGVLPFPGDVMGAILAKVFVEPPPPVASVAPDLPAELDGFFARALAKKKEERFQTIDELVAAFLKLVEQRGELPADVRGSIAGSGPLVGVPLPAPEPGSGRLAGVTPSAPPTPHPGSGSFGATPAPASAPSFPTMSPPVIGTPAPGAVPPRSPLPSSELPFTPAPGLAPPPSPSIATGIATVHDTAAVPGTPPRRRGVWIVAGAMLLVVAGGLLSLWVGGPSAEPATGSAEPALSTGVTAPPPVVPAPTVTPGGPAASGSAAPTVPAPAVSSSAAPTASAGARADTPPPAASTGKSAAPPRGGKGSRGDEWGF